ncbi:MAG TPA: CHAT domain-containing tetratricopeptide repeat protein, partial [Chryseosolibacter sp.]|nr:CHAT domain-containing tetratricopeptide repeat protein [Chryseosolibacter sp.]
GKRSTLWETLYLMGLMYKNTGDLKTSREYLKESVAVIEQIRNKVSGGEEARKLFSSDKQILKVYDVLIDVLLQLGQTEEAMEYLQKNNENNLKAKFKALDVKFEDEKRNRALEEERVMKAKLDGIEEQIAREKEMAAGKQNAEKLRNLEGIKTIAESEYLKFINQQINVQPELSRYFNNSVQPTQFRKIKKQIPADMALLSYLIGENQVYIFAATTDTVIAKIINVPGETITKNVTAVLNIAKSHLGGFTPLDLVSGEAERQQIVNDVLQKDPYLKPFEELYHYLIRPVNAEIAGKKRLGIIPTGSLNYIPFQLLGKTLPSGKFSLLANQYAIFYTSSTDMLFRVIDAEEKNMSILAFGNPDKSLPSTEAEVQDIKRIFPSATVYLREEATEDKAKFAGEQFNVMHFATHGSLDYEDFSKSFLTMAGNPAKSEDGMLTLEELWGMDVMNHLNIVVLSACQTAVTKGSHESSPVSPASGFLQNGVKSVVATLWKVDDEATSVLISEFYKNLRTMEAIDALRKAQVSLSQKPKYAHPYYWAGIVLLGDWR